jgi:murein DD-endopeptidase MepM/ murein hydrolase activator NlpD
MRGYIQKRFFVLLLMVAIILPILPVGATQATRDQLRDAERRRASAGQQVSQQANLLAGTQYEMSQVTAEIQALDQEIVDASDALQIIEYDLVSTELRIEEAQEELLLATAERDAQLKVLRGRVRTMHEQGSTGFIEILFQAESISDFFTRLEGIRTITQRDQELLGRLESAEERRSASLSTLHSDRTLIQSLQTDIEIAMAEIEERIVDRQAFFALLHEDAEQEAAFLAILQEEARVIDHEFGIIRGLYLAEVAEAERIRREADEARRVAEAEARAAAQAERTAALGPFSPFTWPLPARAPVPANISSPFGNRPDPFTGRTAFHSGVDVPAPAGTRINAAADGYVRFAGWSAGWGNYIIIDHAGGYSTLYAHNTRNHVRTGQRVSAGAHIGDVGTTGRSTGNHLHFEIRLNGVHQNPMRYFGG